MLFLIGSALGKLHSYQFIRVTETSLKGKSATLATSIPVPRGTLTSCAHCLGSSLMPLRVAPVSRVAGSWVSGVIEKFFSLGTHVEPCTAAGPDKNACKHPDLQSPVHGGISTRNLDLVSRGAAQSPSSTKAGSVTSTEPRFYGT